MYENFQKEEISRAYVAVVAAAAGCRILEARIDDDGWDLQLGRSGGKSPQVAVSLKTTHDDKRTDTHLSFPLRRSDWDHLRRETLVPRILVVLVVDSDLSATIVHEEEALKLTKGAYWMGLESLDESDSETKVTVYLPRTQQLSPASLTEIMDAVEATGVLP